MDATQVTLQRMAAMGTSGLTGAASRRGERAQRMGQQQIGAWAVAPAADCGAGVPVMDAVQRTAVYLAPCARWCGRRCREVFFLSRFQYESKMPIELSVVVAARVGTAAAAEGADFSSSARRGEPAWVAPLSANLHPAFARASVALLVKCLG